MELDRCFRLSLFPFAHGLLMMTESLGHYQCVWRSNVLGFMCTVNLSGVEFLVQMLPAFLGHGEPADCPARVRQEFVEPIAVSTETSYGGPSIAGVNDGLFTDVGVEVGIQDSSEDLEVIR